MIPSIAAVLERGLAEHPDKEALVGRGGRFTWATLDDAVTAAAAGLRAAGVGAGDRFAVSLPNDVDIVIAFLATQRIRAIWVGINRALAPPEKAWLLEDCDAACFVDTPERWRELVAGGEGHDGAPGAVDPHAPAAIAYTGGTTGYPKGVVHSQHNLLLPGHVSATTGSANPDHVLGVALPLTILNLLVLGPLVAYQVGQTLVAIDRVDPVGLAEWIRDEKVSTFSAVPAMIHDLLHHPDVRDDDLVSLVRPGVGGAAIPEEFRVLYRKRFGTEIYSGYGLTEAPTAVTVESPLEPRVPGSCGKALPQVEIVILDDDGNEVPAGETGEVCVRPAATGPFAGLYTPMLGYWNRPDATAEALRGGVLHTQDIGRIGVDGNLFIEDRKADLIIRGGANVYPAEVERVLHGDPAVAACAVVGAPDERLGERVVAFVQRNGDADLDLDALRARCAVELARYKVPEEFFVVADFERTPMGKIKKTSLRAQLG
ncbi:MAG TPA: AMP-binding protein [Acidimicrobiales bacterium]|nr:AMP-binding protein [Acidimicrobiales bacterium]